MEIFQFCDANIAAKMVKYSMAFACYLPCRISLVLDDAGQALVDHPEHGQHHG